MSIRRGGRVVLKTAAGAVMGRRSSGARQIRSAALHRPAHVECTLQTREVLLIARIVWASQ
jgi:hypothetical protein